MSGTRRTSPIASYGRATVYRFASAVVYGADGVHVKKTSSDSKSMINRCSRLRASTALPNARSLLVAPSSKVVPVGS